ncbi:hypothetical protein [Flagellimonas lutaonensis]|uniref:FeoB-associated Cys-rich membrane protein n=1 Tax=Flagellimonas lutaonensis TaxID=516051 RepID=A0A0D5YSH9_9FLAO|nr:hypothetical protein [Allomuricauda lutaonensis]AKA35215.1 hypothetical protein VC82_1597 [Allomuricauda lutaonensis]
MDILQQILAYLILAAAIAFLAKKFLLPRSLFVSQKEDNKKNCGGTDCGCH